MGEKRRKRSRREILAEVLEAFTEHGGLNKHQLQERAGLKGRHARPYIDDFIEKGLIEWSEEPPTRQSRSGDVNYARALIITERGKCWLRLWGLLQKAEDPTSRVRISFKTRKVERSEL